ncbi:InsB [Shigella sonnei]|nr:InsB [Shigella sonnei]
MLGGADNPNGELPSYITGADTGQLPRDVVSVPRRKGPLRGNPRRPGRQKELRSSGK